MLKKIAFELFAVPAILGWELIQDLILGFKDLILGPVPEVKFTPEDEEPM